MNTDTAGRKPDFIFTLRLPGPNFLRRRDAEKEAEEDTGRKEPPADPVFFNPFPGMRFLSQSDDEGDNEDAGGAAGLILEDYYPDGPLAEIVARQTFVNRIISISILFILILSIVLLYRTYIRITRQREKEQEFIAMISHELRTPLSVIQSASENLSTGIVQKKKQNPGLWKNYL